MGNDRTPRRLVVDEQTTYVWTVRHKHGDGDVCREVLSLHLDGVRTLIVFRAGEGRYVADGLQHSGSAADGRGNLINLREPHIVRALVDEARERELLPGPRELDGWTLFPAVISRAAAATPAAPPGSLPGP
ncbi:hypothetical protein ACFWP7_39625 [Streptomyces sp. NPDC058470]|uniref:hypothetical protein n=1 Tax=Streptomyces sp. NPDC058470 TaxID=3346515 RepID=UPI0036690C6F